MGPNLHTVSACASSANAMIDALNYIRLGYCDVLLPEDVKLQLHCWSWWF